MSGLDRRFNEVDAFIRAFVERAATWDANLSDLADAEPEPDHPDPVLDAAYRSGIVTAPQGIADDGWDSITILRARGRQLAKLIGADGTITSYDAAKHFDLIQIPIAGLDQLEEDLRWLLRQADHCIVRGGIAEIGRSRGVRRLLHADDVYRASLIEVPRRWLAIDIDGLARPANVAASDLVACAGIAIAALPTEFHAARCIVQVTAGHGLKPGLRLRLWFWLGRPVGTVELKRWLPRELVDHAVFSPAQIIYTAAPIFAVGQCDPLPGRLIRLPHGTACVTVPGLPEPEAHPEPAPITPSTGLSPYAEAALNNAARAIATAPQGNRDHALNSQAYGIGRLVGAGAIPEHFARTVLHRAATTLPGYSPRDHGAKIDRSFNNGKRNPREARHG